MNKRYQKICALTLIFAFVLTFLPLNILTEEAYAASVNVTATNAKSITETNATVQGKVSYSGDRPSAVGLYIGTSQNNMRHAASEKINHKKNPFNMWYDLNGEVNMKLQPGTTYYYQCYAIQNGREYKSNVVSFRTPGTAASQQSVVNDSITVTTTNASNITQTNATVQGNVRYTGTRPGTAGIYFGTSSSNMRMIASDAISHNKNPFDMWYDLNSEAGISLQPGTTYYYQCYAIQGGREVKGSIVSFTTPKAAANNSLSVYTSSAKNISTNNATVYGSVSYSGSRPSKVGIYFGTSKSNMSKVASDTINHTKNPFDMWYDLKSEAGVTLKPGTTYYYQCYAIQDGKEVKGTVNSFKTAASTTANTTPSNQEQGMVGSAATTAPEHNYNSLGLCKDCGKEYPLDIIRITGNGYATAFSAAIHDRPYGAAKTIGKTAAKQTYQFSLWDKLTGTGHAQKLDEYAIDAYTDNHYGHRWYRLVKSNGTFIGWISSDNLQLSSSKTDAINQAIMVTMNGKQVDFADQQPIIKNSRLLVPVRAISTAMGKQVTYNDGVIVISDNRKKMTLYVDKKTVVYYEDGMTEADRLDVAPTVLNGRTMLPIRAIAEFFNYQAVWNGDDRKLTVTKK